MILREDGTLCILDWESVGYYPRSFQLASLQHLRDIGYAPDYAFYQMLLNSLNYNGRISSDEKDDIHKVLVVHAASSRYICQYYQ